MGAVRETTSPGIKIVRAVGLSERTRVPLWWLVLMAGAVAACTLNLASRFELITNRLTAIETKLEILLPTKKASTP